MVDRITRLLKFSLQSRRPLRLQAHKAIAIASYIPKFTSSGNSTYLRAQDPDRERAEASKLRREYKQERKGAIKELRKDAKFMAGVVHQQQQEKDRGYNERMKRVHSCVALYRKCAQLGAHMVGFLDLWKASVRSKRPRRERRVA